MERINHTLLGMFRHQLWLEHIEVKEEFQTNTHYVFAVDSHAVCYFSLDNLRRVVPFGIAMLYVEGHKCLCLTILKDS